jgi:hypothetical protein
MERRGYETVFDLDPACRVSWWLPFPDYSQAVFTVGTALRFYEGSHLVGTGNVLQAY